MPAPLVHWRETMNYLARIFLLLLAILIFLTVLGGCGYVVHMRSVQVEEHPVVQAGTSFWIARGPSMEAGEDDEAIRQKIELLLTDKGFALADEDAADHILFFEHEVESLVSRMSLELTTGTRGGMGTHMQEGPFDRTLSVRVVDGKTFRGGTDETVWASTAVIRAAPTESPKFDDLLLLAIFRHFAEDTGEAIFERLNLESQQARRLR